MTTHDYVRGSFVLTTVFLIAYCVLALQGASPVSIYFQIVVGFTILQAAFVMCVMFRTRKPEMVTDERDRAIEAKAFRNAHYLLFGVIQVLLVGLLLFGDWLSPVAVFHILFFGTFASYLTSLGTQLYYYSQGLE